MNFSQNRQKTLEIHVPEIPNKLLVIPENHPKLLLIITISQNISANPMQSKASLSVSNKSNDLERDFSKLSISSQKLVKRIQKMGFELELVSRCAQKIGDDEKKVNFL